MRWLRERAIVLVLVAIVVVVLTFSGLAFYAMHRSKPSRLKLSASLLKLASFSIEVFTGGPPSVNGTLSAGQN